MSCQISSPNERAPIRTVEAKNAEQLGAILAPDVNAVVWRRAAPEELARSCEALAAGQPFTLECTLDVDEPGRLVAAFASLAPDRTRELLAIDVARLVALYAALTERRHVWLQLAVVGTDACRKFHADRVGLRLLCTYAGPGTEWVANEHVDRSFVGRAAPDLATANARIVPDPRAIRRARAGDVLVLKGDAHPGMEARGAVHRSPPIEGSGTRRLVLKLDAQKCGC